MNRLQQLISKGSFASNVDKEEALRMAEDVGFVPNRPTVPKPEFREIFASVEANSRLLDSCAKHNFGDVALPFTVGQRFTCKACGGQMKAVDAFRYIQGFEAAGGNPNEVLNGYKPDWKPNPKQQLDACNFCLAQAASARDELDAYKGRMANTPSTMAIVRRIVTVFELSPDVHEYARALLNSPDENLLADSKNDAG